MLMPPIAPTSLARPAAVSPASALPRRTVAWAMPRFIALAALTLAAGCGQQASSTGAGATGAPSTASTAESAAPTPAASPDEAAPAAASTTAPAVAPAEASSHGVPERTRPTLSAWPADKVALTAGPAIALNCDVSSVTWVGQYLAENNSWGRDGVVGWHQCMGAAANGRGGISAHWTWDWRHQGDNVKAYPEVVFGHKPGYPKSTTPLLPRALGKVQQLTLDYEVATEREGTGNLAIDIWVTSTPTPTEFNVPTITHEVMIWLEVYGPMYAGGQQVDTVRINGTAYRVFVGEQFGLGWRYVAFAPNSPMQMATRMDLLPFFNYLRHKNLIGPNDHLAAINLGNEIIAGAGDTRLNHFSVSVR